MTDVVGKRNLGVKHSAFNRFIFLFFFGFFRLCLFHFRMLFGLYQQEPGEKVQPD